MKTKTLLALLATPLVLASCIELGSDPTTTSQVGVGTTADGGSTTPGPPTTTNGRDLELADCDDPEEDVAIVCEAYELIKENYVDEIDDAVLADAAAEGLRLLDGASSDGALVCATPSADFSTACDLAATAADDTSEAAEAMVGGLAFFALDPNSGYFDAEALGLLEEEQDGEIQGIGALVSPEDATIVGENKQCSVVSESCEVLIVSTITGAPAEAAGLQRDDEIVAVDGESIVGWSVDEVTATVRGPSGTDVTLTIERQGESFDITITRAAVVIPVIEQEVIGDVGYVRLWNFTGTAGSQFEATVVDLLSDGVDELVVDLRDNPGGFLTTAIDVTSVFLDDGDVVVTEGPSETLTYPVNGSSIVSDDIEVTLVVNKGSASASEVVSATLQERGRVTVVGEATFGKNTVQQTFDLSNGGALKLTIARWLTPEGHDFGGTGVIPDVELDVVGLTAEELVAALADV